jgi:succinylglutamate desuccinylase
MLLAAASLASMRVAVVGGTHGNEFTGVYVVEQLEAAKSILHAEYPSLSVETLIANPRAYTANQRFVDDGASARAERCLVGRPQLIVLDTTLGARSHAFGVPSSQI